MFLKKKYKLIKKCEMDFWGISYLQPRQNKFFIYLKKLFTYKIMNPNTKITISNDSLLSKILPSIINPNIEYILQIKPFMKE